MGGAERYRAGQEEEGGTKGRYHGGSVCIYICFVSQLQLLIKWTALPTLRPDMKESFYVGDAVSFHEWSTVLRMAQGCWIGPNILRNILGLPPARSPSVPGPPPTCFLAGLTDAVLSPLALPIYITSSRSPGWARQ